ncbi:MAG: DUF2608 domain-containing protein [Candidatus Dependentiae bacterium]|nr:DUF2608 domain-containing protein [Candidatus Dependentiae bacterium]
MAPFFERAAPEGRLVIFDIDETLVRVQDEEARGSWFSSSHAELMALGKSPEEAKFILFQKHISALYRTDVTLVDQRIPSYLRQLQNKNSNTICLTAREGRCLIYATLRHLDETGIQLPQSEERLKKTLFFPELLEHDVLYACGILFTGGADKGQVLRLFLEKIDYLPSHITFVDDALENVEAVGSVARELAIPFIGFHLIEQKLAAASPPVKSRNRHVTPGMGS